VWTLQLGHIDSEGRARIAIVNAAGDVIDTYWPELYHVAEAVIAWHNDVVRRARALELEWQLARAA